MAVRDGAKTLTKNSEKTLTKNSDPVEPPPEAFTQRKRPELGRFLLRVDRQTKSSYMTPEEAAGAGLAIKTVYPILHVAVYDAVECVSKTVELPAK